MRDPWKLAPLLPALFGCCLVSMSANTAEAPPAVPAAPADLLVLNKIKSGADLPGNLAFVNFETGEVVARVPVGREPHEVGISADGKYALVSNTGSYPSPGNTLSLIDIATRKELRRVDLGALWNPHGIVWHDDRFYFTAEGSRVIGAYDPATDHVVWVMGTGQDTTHLIVFSKDGQTLYTSNRGSASVTVLERNPKSTQLANAWHESFIPVCNGPEGLDLSPDGTQLWVGCRGSNEIGVIDVAQKKMIANFPTRTQAIARVKFTRDGQHVLSTDLHGGELIFWDAATHQELKRLKMGTGCEGILILPDGKQALIGVTNDDNVAVVDLQSMSIVRRIQTGQGPDGMAWLGNSQSP